MSTERGEWVSMQKEAVWQLEAFSKQLDALGVLGGRADLWEADTRLALESQQEQAQNAQNEARMKTNEMVGRMEALRSENEGIKKAIQEVQGQLEALQGEHESLRATYDSDTAALQKEKQEMQQTIDGLKQDVVHANQERDLFRKEKDDMQKQTQDIVDRVKAEKCVWDAVRRQMHNDIQELRGNIRTFCRIRPTLNPEDEMFDFRSTESEVTIAGADGKDNYYSYEKVFLPNHTNSDVFHEVSDLVQSALDGYQISILAYGQTGAGKTHTIEGNSEQKGVIPHAVEKIFDALVHFQEIGWDFVISGSFLEIYNEKIRDLLLTKGEAREDLKVEHKNGETTITGLRVSPFSCPDDIYNMMTTAKKNRATASNDINADSSRSHLVFRLFLDGKNKKLGKTTHGVLNLVDLAGSERVKKSGSDKNTNRFNEARNINKSLFMLSKVLNSLRNKDAHVPYRDSTLTYLLKNSFCSGGKTVLIANIAPETRHIAETVSTCKFASSAGKVNIGPARKNINKGYFK